LRAPALEAKHAMISPPDTSRVIDPRKMG
jgi:hypothetical protein